MNIEQFYLVALNFILYSVKIIQNVDYNWHITNTDHLPPCRFPVHISLNPLRLVFCTKIRKF